MRLFGPINPKFPYPLDNRYYAEIKSDLDVIAKLSNSYVFMKVVCKEDGMTYELQPDGKWKLFTAKGDPGDTGKSLEFRWDGTKLGVRVEGGKDYQYVDLKGSQGDKGKSVEFRWNGTELGIRMEGENTYQYSDLKGSVGKSIEFRWDGTRLGLRQEGESDYQYSDLKGPMPTITELENMLRDTNFDSLETEAKNILLAINELNGKVVDVATTEFEGLETDSKTIVGAINEMNTKINDILLQLQG